MCLVNIFIEFDANCIYFDVFHRFRSECVSAEVDLINIFIVRRNDIFHIFFKWDNILNVCQQK